MSIILETKHLTKKFGKLVAVDKLSFSVEEGIIFGIAGPNGAGKTTLFNVLSGLYKGTGDVIFLDQLINRKPPDKICQFGLARTFQAPAVFNSLSVYDNVRVGGHFGNANDLSKREITEVLDFLCLNDQADCKLENLSLYTKKLTMLASALATNPKLIMLDEPIAGLSPVEIEKSVLLIKRINQELNITIIIIEHLMKVLVGLSTKMMILNEGKIIANGNPEEVTSDKQVVNVYLGSTE